MEKEPLVVLIVINWNGVAIKYKGVPILKLTLDSLIRTKYKNKKIVLVDSGSIDNSIKFVQTNFKGIDIISARDRGLGYSVNKGLEYAYSKYLRLSYIVLLNNDLIFKDENWLEKIVYAAEWDTNIGIVGCRLKYPSGRIQHGGGKVSLTGFSHVTEQRLSSKSRYLDWVTGAVFLIKGEVPNIIGSFDESYLPFYSEDVEYCLRAKKFGYRIYYVGNTNITHLEGYSFTKTKIAKKWTSDQLYRSIHRNSYALILGYIIKLLPTVVLYDLAANFLGRKPKLHFKNIIVGLHRSSLLIQALLDAGMTYKKVRIKKFKRIT